VATDVDSRVILDQTGAQKLLGKGDFLYTMPGLVAPARVQSAFISPEESQKVVNFIKNNNEAYYDEEATNFINSRGGYAGDDSSGSGGSGEKEIDPMYIEALRYVILSGSASISMIQRKCSAGYNRAGKIVEWMEDMGYISPFDGAKARKVLITKEQFEEKYGPLQ
jgi:S-DNA-T family DNA segregation ATPase FtsK/SpoIIIE